MFRMESTYYQCEVGDEVHDLRLDAYEQELAFEPAWVGIDEAIAVNERVLAGGSRPDVGARETVSCARSRDSAADLLRPAARPGNLAAA